MKNTFFENSFWSRLFFALFGFFAITIQGCFGSTASLIACLPLMVWICFNTKKISISLSAAPVFFLCILLLLNYAFGLGGFTPTVAEVFKWLLLICSAMCFTSEYKTDFLLGIFTGITFSTVLGLLAWLRLIPSEYFGIIQLTGDVDGTRQIFSLFGYSNTAAVFFGAAVFMGIMLCNARKSKPLYAMVALNVVALALTFSLFGWLCFLLCLGGYVASRYGKIKIYLVLVAIVAFSLCFVPFVAGSTFISRLIYIEDAISAIKPFGIGYGVWENLKYSVQTAIYSTNYLHNGYLQLALEGGVMSLVFFIAFAVLTVYRLIKNKNFELTAMFILLLLHSLADIDMAYGAVYILFGLAASAEGKKLYPRKFFKPAFALLTTFAVVTAAYGIADLNTPKDVNYYNARIKSGEITVSELSFLYEGASAVHDSESMYHFACMWLEKAPRSQEAYNAVYESIRKIYTATLDENYIKVSMPALYNRMNEANKTMNPLCQYLSKNKYIELP